MQPYFYPYMGYFRLIAAVDLFVLFDCVQFPRRGRVHRTEVAAPGGGRRWLTLPLARQPQTTRIADLAFADGARASLDERLATVPALAAPPPPGIEGVAEALAAPLARPIDTLEANLAATARALGIATPMVRSSSLPIPAELRQAERLCAIARQVGADRYLNSPGGRDLYAAADFAAHGLTLEFLGAYEGPHVTMLENLWQTPLATLAADAARFTIESA